MVIKGESIFVFVAFLLLFSLKRAHRESDPEKEATKKKALISESTVSSFAIHNLAINLSKPRKLENLEKRLCSQSSKPCVTISQKCQGNTLVFQLYIATSMVEYAGNVRQTSCN